MAKIGMAMEKTKTSLSLTCPYSFPVRLLERCCALLLALSHLQPCWVVIYVMTFPSLVKHFMYLSAYIARTTLLCNVRANATNISFPPPSR